jgi:hypothetical protein
MKVVTTVWSGQKQVGTIVVSYAFEPTARSLTPVEGNSHNEVLDKLARLHPGLSYREAGRVKV